MKIVVDWDRCEVNGACMDAAPEIFDINDDDDLVLLDEHPPEALREKAERAVSRCPKAAISIEA
jgi:ferredoxin